jgi:hypothetical protein
MELTEYQYVTVGHSDTDHPNAHITVNMFHPVTGESYKLSNDQYKLDRWCDAYEVKMGVIRSPERRAKFKAAIANDNATAKARRMAIPAEIRAYQGRLKKTQDDAFKRRRNEQRVLWNDYRTAKQAIRSRHQFEIDQIYKHKRNRHALPLSIQGFRYWKEPREWKKLMAPAQG